MNKNVAVVSLALLALLSACSSTSDKKIDYRTGASISNQLEVPPDLVAPTRTDHFDVPSSGETLSGYTEKRKEQGNQNQVSVLGKVSDDMHIERAGTQRWLVVKDTPEDIWPKLRSFFLEQGLILKVDKPDVGIMETDWAENHPIVSGDGLRSVLSSVMGTFYSSGLRDKYRARVELGEKKGTVEIYISHRGLKEVYTDSSRVDTAWEARAPDPTLESEMLRLLMIKLGTDEATAKQLAEKPKNMDEHARIQTNGDGSLQLSIDEEQDRAWRQVGLALDRIGLVVEDRDRSKNVYYVRYVMAEDLSKANGKDSWLGRLFEGKPQIKTGLFQVTVQPNTETAIVQVHDKDGAIDKTDSARQILNLLYNELK